MVNLEGHEAGNGGYRQEKPWLTTPPFYSARENFKHGLMRGWWKHWVISPVSATDLLYKRMI